MSNLLSFVQIVDSQFPRSLIVNDGKTNLKRKLLVVDTEDEFMVDSDFFSDAQCLSYVKEQKDCDVEFSKLLNILDENLGSIYTAKNKKLYGNTKPWKENKLIEMRTRGLVYVTYHCDDENEGVLLYMSFTLTEESGFLPNPDLLSPVIYLYEIQLTSEVRNNGLGSLLINTWLKNCAVEVKNSINNDIIGIELTVFSDNTNAIRFYERLGMILAPDSPRDRIFNFEKRVKTRSQTKTVKASNTNQIPLKSIIKKPDYYLYYLPL